MKHALTILVVTGLFACGGDPEPPRTKDHIWSSQTDMINRAQEVDGLVGDAAARQRQQLDSQLQ